MPSSGPSVQIPCSTFRPSLRAKRAVGNRRSTNPGFVRACSGLPRFASNDEIAISRYPAKPPPPEASAPLREMILMGCLLTYGANPCNVGYYSGQSGWLFDTRKYYRVSVRTCKVFVGQFSNTNPANHGFALFQHPSCNDVTTAIPPAHPIRP
jgi:hypothetical protein